MDRRDDKREDLKSYLHFLIIETTKEKWNDFHKEMIQGKVGVEEGKKAGLVKRVSRQSG